MTNSAQGTLTQSDASNEMAHRGISTLVLHRKAIKYVQNIQAPGITYDLIEVIQRL